MRSKVCSTSDSTPRYCRTVQEAEPEDSHNVHDGAPSRESVSVHPGQEALR